MGYLIGLILSIIVTIALFCSMKVTLSYRKKTLYYASIYGFILGVFATGIFLILSVTDIGRTKVFQQDPVTYKITIDNETYVQELYRYHGEYYLHENELVYMVHHSEGNHNMDIYRDGKKVGETSNYTIIQIE